MCHPPCWQATQKGDPVAVLKRQLEEKERQLSAEQEDAAAAKNKLRELSKVSPVWPSWHPQCGLCSWCLSMSFLLPTSQPPDGALWTLHLLAVFLPKRRGDPPLPSSLGPAPVWGGASPKNHRVVPVGSHGKSRGKPFL